MQLNIAGTRLLCELQNDFNKNYPYLKLEFFRPSPAKFLQATSKNMLQHSLTIQQARRLQHDGWLEIHDSMKVSELENTLRQSYGLNAQIFRKSGNVWLETTMSDDWTLKQQNNHGQEISTFTTLSAKPDQDDYREHQ